jgi:galactose oxidase
MSATIMRLCKRACCSPGLIATQVFVVVLALMCGIMQPAHAMTGVPYGEIVATHSGKCVTVDGGSQQPAARISQSACMQAPSELWEVLPTANLGYYQVSSQNSGMCLTIQANIAAPIVQMPCDGDPYQGWSIVAQAAGGYILQSQQTGFCLDVKGASQTDKAKLIQLACNGAANQLFQFEQNVFTGNAPVAIMSQLSGQCVGIQDGSPNPSADSVQYPCGTEANDTWTLQPVAAGIVNVVNAGTGQCLDVFDWQTQAGTPVDQYYCHAGYTNQQWLLQPSGNTWQLVAQNSGLCLTISGGSLAAGTQLVIEPCANGAGANWTFHVPNLPAVWAPPVATQSIAVAAANLPNGQLLTWASDWPDNFTYIPQTYTEILDPVAGTDSEYLITDPAYNMFCPGIANLPNGQILVNGGDTNINTSLYNPANNTWTAAAPMNIGRGYEGTVLNSDGTVFTLGGSWNTNQAGVTPGELWRPTTGWTLLSNIPSNPVWTNDDEGPYRADNHLWLHVLSGGRLLHAGPSATMHWIDVYGDGGLGTIVSAGARGTDGDSMNGNASAFDVDKLLKVGGAPDYDESPSTPNAVLIDGSGAGNPVVTQLAPMNYARGFGNSVVLPNGQVVVVGGQTYDEPFTDTDAVLVPEIWDPSTQVFATMAPMVTPRTYHSTALLLPDGRVWVSGGGLCGNNCGANGANHLNYEILTPPYLLTAGGGNATRPVISSVSKTTLKLGAKATIVTQSPVKSFALMRLSSVTHTVNNDQRRIPLAATTSDGAHYKVKLSNDPGVLLAGYYMLFALDPRGVPSEAVTVLIE